MPQDCVFCRIVRGEVKARTVYEDEMTIVFLDSGPLFAGHCLVCPRQHYDTLLDVPNDRLEPLFATAKLIGAAVERGLGAQGSFMAINNRISQSVPHLHVHVVPRRRQDGLKGFFWPRRPYKDEEEAAATQKALQEAVSELLSAELATRR
jgi:histidine triad (HIT) family protein